MHHGCPTLLLSSTQEKRMNRSNMKLSFASLALVLIPGCMYAAPRTKAQMKQAAALALFGNGSGNKIKADMNRLKELKTSDGYTIYGTDGGGFAVVAADDAVQAILGYSDATFTSAEANPNFAWWLNMTDEAVMAHAKAGTTPRKTPLPADLGFKENIPALCQSRWGQDAPYNNMCPTATDGTRTLTGCAATSTAQVLYYHRAPGHGSGSHTIYYPANNTSGVKISVDFGESSYDWNAMLDSYASGYSSEEGDAVALIMRDLGVAFDMEYGSDAEGGSGALHSTVAVGLQRYFGIQDAKYVVRADYSEEEWMRIVYDQINRQQPIVYGGFDRSMGGHSFVLDGYDAQGNVHVNWGWDGSYDGYYDIAILDPSGYRFENNQEAVINILPDKTTATKSDTVTVGLPGALASLIDTEMFYSYDILKVNGDINAADLRTLRSMAGRDANGDRTRGRLRELDLSEARIVSGDDYYMTDNGKKLTVSRDNTLPDKVFSQCSLEKITLPQTGISSFGTGVWAYSSKLKEVALTPSADADFTFDGRFVYSSDNATLLAAVPVQHEGADVPHGVTAIADYAFAGCTLMPRVSLSSDVKTIGKEAFANCWSMAEFKVFAKEVPQLGGAGVFSGANTESCKLTVRAGAKQRFANAAQWKDFENIVEFGTTVKARNAAREYGDKNPRLTFTVSGDKVDGTPELTCEATPESPVGRYTIHIAPGTIADEGVDFEDGYLVVTQAPLDITAADATREQGAPNPEFAIEYSGFKNGETADVLTVKPVASCEADETSPIGTYTITVGGGEAENYELFYTDGLLTVTAATGVEGITADQQNGKAFDVYTVDGRCVARGAKSLNELDKGIYIINGKKIVK